MENDFYHKDFEELIKERADQYKMYPSDKVWKGINNSLRSRRKWYWSGFVLLLSGVSYFAITELMSPVSSAPITKIEAPAAPKPQVSAEELIPFPADAAEEENILPPLTSGETVTSDLLVEDSGNITASFEIPMKYLPGNDSATSSQKAAFLISGLEPLSNHEQYNIELSWPVDEELRPSEKPAASAKQKITLNPQDTPKEETKAGINWFEDHVSLRVPSSLPKRIRWQLAFSPTVNYRRLTGGNNAKLLSRSQNIPMSLDIEGDVNKVVNHKPALGFELGSHALLPLGRRVSLKGGIQFNYSKYDIRAFRAPSEVATIALNSQVGTSSGGSILSYTNLRNFGGNSVEVLKNQYYQLSVPLGFEVRVFGNQNLQFNIASTIQPTYLINKNTYLITTDFKNYTKAPSLVRRWNVNAGAEAFLSYRKGDVKWQVGPQFRYQLLSSYQNEYPIKEYLMEYGIKVGITKTIR